MVCNLNKFNFLKLFLNKKAKPISHYDNKTLYTFKLKEKFLYLINHTKKQISYIVSTYIN